MLKKAIILFFIISQNINSKVPIFCVEGNTGSGKTTLIKALSKRNKKYIHVKEPVDKVQNMAGENILELYFNDLKRWSFTNNLAFHILQIEELQRAMVNYPKGIYITDRSIFGLLYAFVHLDRSAGYLQSSELLLYEKIVNLTLPLVKKPSGFIYLRTNVDTAYQRIQSRGRSEELSVPKEYWYQLHDAYENMFIHSYSKIEYLKDIPVLVIDGNNDMLKSPNCLETMVSEIEKFIEHILNT